MKMKFSVIYYSENNHTKTMADEVLKGASKVQGIEAKAFSLDKIDEKFLNESQVVMFGTPVHNGGMCWQMKKWFIADSEKYQLSGKLGGAFATAGYLQGGLTVVCMEAITHMLVKGMLVYSSGTTEDPYLHFGAVSTNDTESKDKVLFSTMGERMAKEAKKIFK